MSDTTHDSPEIVAPEAVAEEETHAATKAAVFAAAERLFALHGFQNVSVRDITAEAGVNLASVNYHFGSKDALLFEIFRRRTAELNRDRARMLGCPFPTIRAARRKWANMPDNLWRRG